MLVKEYLHQKNLIINNLFSIEESKCINFQGTWPSEDRANFLQHMTIIENFLSEDDENKLLNELEPYLKRMRYEFDHWDDVK